MDRRDLTDKIKIKPIRQLARWVRKFTFLLINLLGESIFYIFRLFKILPPPPVFEREKIKKILIVRPDMIGDVVLATPVIKAARNNFPQAHIAMVVSGLTKDIVMKNPYLNEVIVVKGVGFHNLIKDYKVIGAIKRKKFDLALILFSALSCNIFVFLTGIPCRIGYGDRGSSFLLTKALKLKGFEKHAEHMIDLNLDVLRAVDCKADSKELNVSVYEDSEERARIFFEQNNVNPEERVVMIHPGSTRSYQRWPADKFIELADKLIAELKVKIIFLSGPLDGNLVKDITGKMRYGSVIASGLSLKDVISLIKRCDLFIGHSTGTTHIANALGISAIMIVSFFNSLDDPRIWRGLGSNSRIVSKYIGCEHCMPADCRGFSCMKEISVEEVFEVAQQQISNSKRK